MRHRRGRALRRRYGRSRLEGWIRKLHPPGYTPSEGWVRIQRMMRVYAKRSGLGAYVPNSAIPDGGGGWSFYAKKSGGKTTRHVVPMSLLETVYAK